MGFWNIDEVRWGKSGVDVQEGILEMPLVLDKAIGTGPMGRKSCCPRF